MHRDRNLIHETASVQKGTVQAFVLTSANPFNQNRSSATTYETNLLTTIATAGAPGIWLTILLSFSGRQGPKIVAHLGYVH